MANEANPLDEFLRNAEQSASFSVNEDHWKKMERQLDEEIPNKKRRLLPTWWKGGFLVVLGMGIASLVWQFNRPKQSNNISSSIQSKQISSFKAEQVNATPPVINSSTNETQSSQKIASVQSTNQRSSSSTSLSEKYDATSITSLSTDSNTSESAFENHRNTSPIKSTAIQSIRKKINTRSNSTPDELATNNEIKSPPSNKKISNASAGSFSYPTSPQWVQGKAMQAVDTEIQWRRAAMSQEEMIRYNPRYQAHLKNYQYEKNDSVTIIHFKPIVANVLQPSSHEASDTTINTYRLHLMVGAMLWRGFIGGDTWSPAPSIGLGFEKKLTPRITMASQVGFTFFSGLQTQNRTVSYRYKFGLDSTVYSALHRMVFRIQWPIQFKYAFNKQHALMAGGGAAWQPDGISSVTAPAQVLNGGSAPLNNAPLQSKNTLGFLHGIRTWDFFLQAGYQWQWHERMALQLLWQAGLRDMTDNKILSSNRIQRNNGLMIGLRYSFVRSNR